MIVLRDSSSFPPTYRNAVLALGNFDGLHLGHRAVIGKAATLARETGKPLGIMTFEPHPRRIFQPHLPPLRILPLREKLRELAAMEVSFLRVIRFTKAFSQTTATDFVTRILHDTLHVSHVVTGDDFVFGHNREGTTAILGAMAAKLGFAATACAQLDIGGERCSSTRIREALMLGNVELAARLLGRPYSISGHVREGDKRGRTIGFPTANILPAPIFLPRFGVYAVRTQVNGRPVTGVANLGLRPTFGGTRVRLETHLFDWQGDIYGQRLNIELAHFLRSEQRFDGIEALKTQIVEDSRKARGMLA